MKVLGKGFLALVNDFKKLEAHSLQCILHLRGKEKYLVCFNTE